MRHSTSKIIFIIVLLNFFIGVLGVVLYFSDGSLPRSEVQADERAQVFMSDCSDAYEKERCYADRFYAFTKEHAVGDSLTVLTSLQAIDATTNYCHLIAHKIAIAEVEKNPTEWLGMLQKVNLSSCSRGFFHGVIEGYTQTNAGFSLTTKTIPEICTSVSQYLKEKQSEKESKQVCVHAIGHMVLVQEKGAIAQSVALCDTLPKDWILECQGGVFMEEFGRDNLSVHGIAERLTWTTRIALAQKETCSGYAGTAATACWGALGQMFGLIADASPQVLQEYCLNAPSIALKEECQINGFGLMAMLIADGKTNKKTHEGICQTLQENATTYKRCITFVVSFLVNSSPKFRTHAESYCQTLAEEYKQYCISYLAKNENVAWITSEGAVGGEDIPVDYSTIKR